MKTKKNGKLSKTDSIQALAKFWDAHDLTNFTEELEEVKETVFARAVPIRLKLPPAEAIALRRIAKSRGMSQAQLIQHWVLQHLGSGKGNYHTKART